MTTYMPASGQTRQRSNVVEFEGDLSVVARENVSEGVIALELCCDENELPVWTPGAHIDLLLEPGLVRQYSLCGDPRERSRWRVGVLREEGGRGGSRYVHDSLAVGSKVRVRGPRNTFELDDAPGYRFVAGGIGITPLLPMIAEAHRLGKPWSLLYGGRSQKSMAFVSELERYGPAVRIHPQDRFGFPDLASELARVDRGTLIYACGPEAMLKSIEEASGHWEPGSLRTERFGPVGPSDAASGPFTVRLARSGIDLEIPSDRSVLEMVHAAGVDVDASCESGVCGTCITTVLSGSPDHQDSVLTESERQAEDCMTICVSRSRTPELMLDL